MKCAVVYRLREIGARNWNVSEHESDTDALYEARKIKREFPRMEVRVYQQTLGGWEERRDRV